MHSSARPESQSKCKPVLLDPTFHVFHFKELFWIHLGLVIETIEDENVFLAHARHIMSLLLLQLFDGVEKLIK